MKLNRLSIPGILGVATLMTFAAGSLLVSLRADAVTSTTTTTATPATPPDQSQAGHVGANGVKEELLSGETAIKATAAAQSAVPNGTILRVENDAEGATYEAHVRKSDGSEVTCRLQSHQYRNRPRNPARQPGFNHQRLAIQLGTNAYQRRPVRP